MCALPNISHQCWRNCGTNTENTTRPFGCQARHSCCQSSDCSLEMTRRTAGAYGSNRRQAIAALLYTCMLVECPTRVTPWIDERQHAGLRQIKDRKYTSSGVSSLDALTSCGPPVWPFALRARAAFSASDQSAADVGWARARRIGGSGSASVAYYDSPAPTGGRETHGRPLRPVSRPYRPPGRRPSSVAPCYRRPRTPPALRDQVCDVGIAIPLQPLSNGHNVASGLVAGLPDIQLIPNAALHHGGAIVVVSHSKCFFSLCVPMRRRRGRIASFVWERRSRGLS